jgi:uncharacterized protein
MEHFTPIAALAGGALIGVGATLLLVLNGRIAGISGILAGLLTPRRGDTLWRLAFLGGLVLGAFVWLRVEPDAPLVVVAGMPLLLVGGFLTGFGARFGGGCASGHGVCGLGRLSIRSFAAVAMFMLTCGITVWVMRHAIGI